AGVAADPVGDEEADALFDADLSEPDPAVLHAVADHLKRALVLLPDPDLAAERRLDQLAGAILLESGTHVRDGAPGGNDDAQGAFALAPAHADVIEAAAAPFHEDSVDPLLLHEPLGPRDPRLPLVVGDGDDAGGHRLEGLDRRRDVAVALRRIGPVVTRHANPGES